MGFIYLISLIKYINPKNIITQAQQSGSNIMYGGQPSQVLKITT